MNRFYRALQYFIINSSETTTSIDSTVERLIKIKPLPFSPTALYLCPHREQYIKVYICVHTYRVIKVYLVFNISSEESVQFIECSKLVRVCSNQQSCAYQITKSSLKIASCLIPRSHRTMRKTMSCPFQRKDALLIRYN